MEIILARHGKPLLEPAPISGREIGRWVQRYDQAGITPALAPPDTLRRLGASAACVVASSLPRSIDSARWISPREVRIDDGLREAALPESIAVSVRMPPGVWIGIARAAWRLDWCRSPEPFEAARTRARLAADRLCALAEEHDSVLVVGHGMFNRLIAADLSRRGWRGPRLMPGGYWAAARFIRSAGRRTGEPAPAPARSLRLDELTAARPNEEDV